jgi:hypothetical protein
VTRWPLELDSGCNRKESLKNMLLILKIVHARWFLENEFRTDVDYHNEFIYRRCKVCGELAEGHFVSYRYPEAIGVDQN